MEPLYISTRDWRSRWLVFSEMEALHRVAVMKWEDFDELVEGEGKTLCGKSGQLQMPGIFSRMNSPRCEECCKLMGIPHGSGNPYNKGIYEECDQMEEE